jgi:integrase
MQAIACLAEERVDALGGVGVAAVGSGLFAADDEWGAGDVGEERRGRVGAADQQSVGGELLILGQERTTKGKRVRSVPLADQAAAALGGLSRREDFTASDDLVFCTDVGGYVSGDAIRDEFYRALESAGLRHLRHKDDPIVPYDLRHTFGTLAVRANPLTDVQAWMGHKHISTTMRYVHYVPQHGAAAKLTAAFTPAPAAGLEGNARPRGSGHARGTQ